MANDMDHPEHDNEFEALRSRRSVLRMMAAVPLLVTSEMLASPLMRFLKPTMRAGNFFQKADLPQAERPPRFNESDFPKIGSCLPFTYPLKLLVFNAEQYEIREIPSFAIRTETNQIVAFSRICPHQRNHILNYAFPTTSGSCGCCDKSCKGECIEQANTPILVCPCDQSTFDVKDKGRVLRGPARSTARQFTVERNGDWICISRLEGAVIV